MKEKPTALASLVDRIKYEAEIYANMPTSTMELAEYERTKGISQGLYKAVEIISCYQPAESLAELADRKGFEGIQIYAPHDNTGWAINMIVNGVERTISAYETTYADAESKAKSYLTSLPDKR